MGADTALWIKNVRRRAGFSSQGDLALALGVGRSAVGNWEAGRGVPSMSHAERFAVVTNRPRSEVLAKFGYPIGGGDPMTQLPASPPPEWLTAIQASVAAGVADGLAQVLDRLQAEGWLRTADRPARPQPRRRSA
jgi:DNA-binding XRE family transcriptional regulator